MSAPADQIWADIARPACDGHVAHHGPATHIVRIHQLDCCQPRGDRDPRALTPDGAIVLLLCLTCLSGTARRIQGDISNRLAALPRGTHRIACLTCGRPIACLHDILEAERI
ncbi:hypothetical protein [Mycobacterium marinum]|uniref:hypothetical protein n=1 Tax=Mycobacterium marinum TaxID=1781 RepID=UPI00356B320C